MRLARRPAARVVLAVLAVLAAVAVATVVIKMSRTGSYGSGVSTCSPSGCAIVRTSLANFLGVAMPSNAKWRAVDGVGGKEYEANLPDVGYFHVDASGLVTLGVFALSTRQAPASVVTIDRAQVSATSWAQAHHLDLSRLTLRQTSMSDRGTFTEYDFRWQAKEGLAWLPTFVDIGINGSGQISDFVHEAVRTTIGTSPHISAAGALKQAQAAAPAGVKLVGSPELEVVVRRDGSEELVWVYSYSRSNGNFVPILGSATVDAQSGAVVVA